MRLALYQPDIAGNVGTILRMAACFGLPVDLIEPMGFPFGDRAMSRAGMDYIRDADVTRHADWHAFLNTVTGRIVLLTTRGATRIDAAQFQCEDVLLFGAESSGVPDHVHARADARVMIPLVPGLRSLNVAVAAAIATGEALRQTGSWPRGNDAA